MLILDFLADRRIDDAISRGELDALPGAGRPLDLDDDDPLAPPETRMARRILKNSGFDDARLDEEVRFGRQHALRCLSHIREVTA